MADRSQRRFARHLAEARLPPGKTLDAFDFNAVPTAIVVTLPGKAQFAEQA